MTWACAAHCADRGRSKFGPVTTMLRGERRNSQDHALTWPGDNLERNLFAAVRLQCRWQRRLKHCDAWRYEKKLGLQQIRRSRAEAFLLWNNDHTNTAHAFYAWRRGTGRPLTPQTPETFRGMKNYPADFRQSIQRCCTLFPTPPQGGLSLVGCTNSTDSQSAIHAPSKWSDHPDHDRQKTTRTGVAAAKPPSILPAIRSEGACGHAMAHEKLSRRVHGTEPTPSAIKAGQSGEATQSNKAIAEVVAPAGAVARGLDVGWSAAFGCNRLERRARFPRSGLGAPAKAEHLGAHKRRASVCPYGKARSTE